MTEFQRLRSKLLEVNLVGLQCSLLLCICAFLSKGIRSSETESASPTRLTLVLVLALLEYLSFFSRQIMHKVQLGVLLEVFELHQSKVILFAEAQE